MSDKLVTVGTFATPVEARVARMQLEAAGVHGFLADEAMVGMAWHLGTAPLSHPHRWRVAVTLFLDLPVVATRFAFLWSIM